MKDKRKSEAAERVTGAQQWNDVIPLITVEIGWQMMQKHGVVHKMIKNDWIWQWYSAECQMAYFR